ncbi:FadR/GntR family transcriptional regulator [Nesterenkonia xinjiangensis]|uniref:GntR family transcriptional repressor for pyruvate dehydrogenase complex n=1 Tax=Nesterenkonia xinjiangensis TaxID=225327 RepID=A0A7Z0KBP3_9MICC|nr:FCD domain-containing protein [Nesterenkonia xinjiangensis]NYJ77827.1 GntR family transcriptional repressor for pyruvate dehydrogenase complex [Nesterenkonia xinjiangensis]
MSINRTTALTEHLRRRILDGEIAVGEKLPSEAQLITEHKVSRTVVREALGRLQIAGLIRTRRGAGSFALTPPAEHRHDAPPPPHTPEERATLIEYRMALECEAAALAARRRSPAQLENLRAALEAFAQGADHPATAVEQDFMFHREIAAASGNPHLLSAVEQLGPSMIAMPRPRLETTHDDASRPLAEHQAVLDAVAEGDPTAASAAMRSHLSASRRRVLAD